MPFRPVAADFRAIFRIMGGVLSRDGSRVKILGYSALEMATLTPHSCGHHEG